LFFSHRVKKHTMNNIDNIDEGISDITEEINDIRNKIEYHENLRETILDIKRLDLNIAFLKNKLKSLQTTIIGLRACKNINRESLQIQLLVIERMKELITERQEIAQEISDNGYVDDNTYNLHCMYHKDMWGVLNSSS